MTAFISVVTEKLKWKLIKFLCFRTQSYLGHFNFCVNGDTSATEFSWALKRELDNDNHRNRGRVTSHFRLLHCNYNGLSAVDSLISSKKWFMKWAWFWVNFTAENGFGYHRHTNRRWLHMSAPFREWRVSLSVLSLWWQVSPKANTWDEALTWSWIWSVSLIKPAMKVNTKLTVEHSTKLVLFFSTDHNTVGYIV